MLPTCEKQFREDASEIYEFFVVLRGADLFEDVEIYFEGVLVGMEELLEQLWVLLVLYHIIIQQEQMQTTTRQGDTASNKDSIGYE